jgi:hypothetical protein
MTSIANRNNATALEQVLVSGNLSALSPDQRLDYYNKLCDSLGLNPLTKPFEYITLNGKLTLYARKDATDQLRKIHNVSIMNMRERDKDGIVLVTVDASDASGRLHTATGGAAIQGLKGDALVNAYLKAETKAIRRATLGIVGLGMLDETEVETIKDVTPAEADTFKLDDVEMNFAAAHSYIRGKIEAIIGEDSLNEYKEWKEDHKQELTLFAKSAPRIASQLAEMSRKREQEVEMMESKYNVPLEERFKPMAPVLMDDQPQELGM